MSGSQSFSNSACVFHADALKLKWIAPRRAFGMDAATSAHMSACFAALRADRALSGPHAVALAPAAATPAAAPRKPRRSRRRPPDSSLIDSSSGMRPRCAAVTGSPRAVYIPFGGDPSTAVGTLFLRGELLPLDGGSE